jgi:hypothetical protein
MHTPFSELTQTLLSSLPVAGYSVAERGARTLDWVRRGKCRGFGPLVAQPLLPDDAAQHYPARATSHSARSALPGITSSSHASALLRRGMKNNKAGGSCHITAHHAASVPSAWPESTLPRSRSKAWRSAERQSMHSVTDGAWLRHRLADSTAAVRGPHRMARTASSRRNLLHSVLRAHAALTFGLSRYTWCPACGTAKQLVARLPAATRRRTASLPPSMSCSRAGQHSHLRRLLLSASPSSRCPWRHR